MAAPVLTHSADNIYIIGRQQEKEGKDVVGYNFIINVEKIKTRTRKRRKYLLLLLMTVAFLGGVALLDIALDGGFVVKPSNGWYQRVDVETGEVVGTKVRAKDTDNAEFWMPILTESNFSNYVKNKYSIAHTPIIHDTEVADFLND